MLSETEIVRRLLTDEHYLRRAISYLKPEFFDEKTCHLVFCATKEYFDEYAATPTKLVLQTHIEDLDGKQATDLEVQMALQQLDTFFVPEEIVTELDWMMKSTEIFMKAKSLLGAIMQSHEIFDSIKDGNSGALAQLVPLFQDAVSVGFDFRDGKEYFESAIDRFRHYTEDEELIPFGIDALNDITNGGLPAKTLSVIMAGTGVGKTLSMCSMAADNLRQGKNVLYVTFEISEYEILRRLDANLLDIPILQLPYTKKDDFFEGLMRVHENSGGKFVVKEYPPGAAGVAHIRRYIDEIRVKKGFVPDIIYVDYINLCATDRANSKAGMYEYLKAVAEDVRALAVEQDVPIVTATQANRSGMKSSDMDLDNQSECLSPETKVKLFNGIYKRLEDIATGDMLCGKDGRRTVQNIFEKQTKSVVAITTESGKRIIASVDHEFWTPQGMMSVSDGLAVKDTLEVA